MSPVLQLHTMSFVVSKGSMSSVSVVEPIKLLPSGILRYSVASLSMLRPVTFTSGTVTAQVATTLALSADVAVMVAEPTLWAVTTTEETSSSSVGAPTETVAGSLLVHVTVLFVA